MSTLYLCGVGNGEGIRLALQVDRVQHRWQRIVLLDDDPARHGTQRLGLGVAGGFELLRDADPAHDRVVNLVTRTTTGRARARERIAAFGIPFASLVHPDVDLLGAELDDEVTVYARAGIGAECRVGRSTVVLPGAIVGHGACVGPGCVIAPNAVINARVRLGEGVYVGSNASVLPDVRVGAGATIGANTLVATDVPEGATALGVPAEIIERQPDAAASTPRPEDQPVRAATSDRAQLEADVVAAMQQVLGAAHVPRAGNFFDLGGTSLKALQLCQRLREQLGLGLQPLDLFRFPTVAALVGHLAGPPVASGSVLPLAQQRAALRRAPWRR